MCVELRLETHTSKSRYIIMSAVATLFSGMRLRYNIGDYSPSIENVLVHASYFRTACGKLTRVLWHNIWNVFLLELRIHLHLYASLLLALQNCLVWLSEEYFVALYLCFLHLPNIENTTSFLTLQSCLPVVRWSVFCGTISGRSCCWSASSISSSVLSASSVMLSSYSAVCNLTHLDIR